MRIKLREYKTTNCEQMAKLFYNTVHSVNAKDYTERISIISIEAKSIYIDVPVAICSGIGSIYIICN